MPHIHEKFDFTVEVFIVHNETVLLHKHKKLGKWLSIGGHIELDEDPIDACYREVKEEMGLDIELVGSSEAREFSDATQLTGPMYLNRNQITDTHEHITFVYFARPATPEVTPEDGITEWKWFLGKTSRTMTTAFRKIFSTTLSRPRYARLDLNTPQKYGKLISHSGGTHQTVHACPKQNGQGG